MKALNYTAITISLVFCIFAGTSQKVAANVGLDIGTFQTIAAGHATESKCRQLNSADREELATHAAFAETAAVKSNGSGSVMAARKRARSSAQCGADARSRAQAALNAGRKFEQRYVDNRRVQTRAKTRKAKRRQARRNERQRRVRPRTTRAAALTHTTRRTTNRRHEIRTVPRVARGSIARFRSQTRAYYLQRRCNHLSYRDALQFWKLIAAQHKRMIRRYGAGSVQRAQSQARASASRTHCSPSTKRQVVAGLRGVRRDVN